MTSPTFFLIKRKLKQGSANEFTQRYLLLEMLQKLEETAVWSSDEMLSCREWRPDLADCLTLLPPLFGQK